MILFFFFSTVLICIFFLSCRPMLIFLASYMALHSHKLVITFLYFSGRYRLTVLRALPHLQKLDNIAVDSEEVQKAMVCGVPLPFSETSMSSRCVDIQQKSLFIVVAIGNVTPSA